MASIIKKVYRRITDWKWNIALCDTPVDELIAGKPLRARWLKHNYTDRWFADPFILYADDDEVHFLVEEYTYKDKTGRIARLVADRRTMELKSRHSVLELDSHLSFPAIMRHFRRKKLRVQFPFGILRAEFFLRLKPRKAVFKIH